MAAALTGRLQFSLWFAARRPHERDGCVRLGSEGGYVWVVILSQMRSQPTSGASSAARRRRSRGRMSSHLQTDTTVVDTRLRDAMQWPEPCSNKHPVTRGQQSTHKSAHGNKGFANQRGTWTIHNHSRATAWEQRPSCFQMLSSP